MVTACLGLGIEDPPRSGCTAEPLTIKELDLGSIITIMMLSTS